MKMFGTAFFTDERIGAPSTMFGTKCPSITSERTACQRAAMLRLGSSRLTHVQPVCTRLHHALALVVQIACARRVSTGCNSSLETGARSGPATSCLVRKQPQHKQPQHKQRLRGKTLRAALPSRLRSVLSQCLRPRQDALAGV
jgi:hypothetical protein